MKITKRQDNAPRRLFRKPELVNYEAVDKYIKLFGTPVCQCCFFITFTPLFFATKTGWTLYCINCGITRQVTGQCQHDPAEDMSKRMINPAKTIDRL